jgi:hypothetical protein
MAIFAFSFSREKWLSSRMARKTACGHAALSNSRAKLRRQWPVAGCRSLSKRLAATWWGEMGRITPHQKIKKLSRAKTAVRGRNGANCGQSP